MRRLILPVFAFAALLVACGGGGGPSGSQGIEGSPESALEQVLDLMNEQQWGREWDSLHPEQQKMVARDAFISCSESAESVAVRSLKVLKVNDEEAAIPGTGTRAPSKAIVVEFELTKGFRKGKSSDIFYLFDVDGRWRWVLSNANVEAYKAGACPA